MKDQFKKLVKVISLIALGLSMNTVLFAQTASNGIFFQAVARDTYGNPAKDRKVYIVTSVLQTSATGTNMLTELHQALTDATGVFGISIGQGTRTGGTVANIQAVDWSKGPYFLNLKVAIEPFAPVPNWDYKTELIDLGTTSFGTVPYALFANTVAGFDTKLNVADSATKYVTPSQLASKTFDQTPILNAIGTKLNIADSTTKYVTPSQLAAKTFDSTAIYNQLALKATTTTVNSSLATKLNIADSVIKYVTPTQLAAKTFDSTAIYNQLALKANTTDVNTALALKANTTDVNTALNTKENVANKSLDVTVDAVSDVKYPSVKAIKTYVDASITANTTPLTFTAPLSKSGFTVGIPQANGSNNGYLSSTDWTSFNNKIDATQKATANGVATLGNDGKIPSVQIPAISFQSASVVSSQAAMLSIAGAVVGSIAIRTDNNKNYVLSASPSTTLSNWIELATPNSVTSVNGFAGPNVTLTTNDINEGATNKYYTDARARGALSATAPLVFNNSTGAFSIPQASTTTDGFLSANDWNTFKNKQNALDAGTDYVTPSGNITGNAANVTGVVAVANGGTGSSTAVGALANLGAEATANKSNDIAADAASTTKYPSVKSIKDYVDQQSANAGVADNSITSAKISGTIAITKGGTGATTAAAARTNLGLVIGTDVMAATATTTLTGDVTGTGNGSFATTVNSVGGISSSTIAGLPTSVAANTASITANTNSIATLNTNVAANTASITANTNSIATLNTNVVANTASITAETSRATNTENALDTRVTSNTASITAETTRATNAENALDTRVTSNTASITAETTRATNAENALDTRVTSNTASITSNTNSIATLNTNVSSNTASITANTNSIATLNTNVSSNTTSITAETTRATNAENALDTRVISNTASITSNTNSIATNSADILLRAPLASPTFTGTPSAPTPATNDNSTTLATTAYVKNSITAANAGLSTIGAISGTSNAKGATISGTTELILTPADASNGGVVTTGTQTFAGSKTFTNTVTFGKDITVNGMTFGRPANPFASNSQNIAIGNNVLGKYAPTHWTTDYNIGIGYSALFNLTNGGENVAIGSTAMYLLSSGDYNTGIGSSVMSVLTTGNNNTVLGAEAGRGISTGSENTFIGSYTGVGMSGSNNILIGSNKANNYSLGTGITTGNSNTIIGSGIRSLPTTLSNNVILADGDGNIRAQHNGTSGWTLGTIVSGTWSGTVIGSNVGGAGTVNGLMKANGSGLVSAAVAGTDYLTPSGSAASLTNFPTLNQNTTGNASTATLAGDITATSNTTLTSLANLNAVGTITSGVWSATEIAIAKGGTGATTATGALTNLGAQSVANMSTNITTDAASTSKYPSVKLIKDYVDTRVASAGVSDGSITSAKITDGTIVNADVSTTAAIAFSKLNIAKSDITSLGIQESLTAGSGISINAGTISATGLTTSNLASNAAITNAQLANSTTTLGSTTMTLGGTVTSVTGLSALSATNLTGALTGNASTATALATGRTISTTGDVTYTSGSFDGTSDVTGVATLAASGVSSGTYGSSTAIPVLTVDTKGRVTSASTVGIIAGVNSLNYTSTTSYANGGTISGTSLTLAAASATDPGLISTGAQTIAGAKTFSSDVTATNFIGNATTATTAGNITATSNTTLTSLANLATVGTITAGTWSATEIAITKGGTGASTASGARTNLGLGAIATKSTIADADVDASAAIAFSKLNITKANITGLGVQEGLTAGSGISISAGTISATGLTTSNLASNAAITNAQLANSTTTLGSTTMTLGGTVTSVTGLTSVSSTGFTGALTGNASTATKLAATKNINGVAFDGSADITIAADANTLTGTTLASNVVNSSLTSVGTITSGVWSGTAIAIAKGGTGATTKTEAFDALSPMTSSGDIIYGGTSGSGTRLAKGTNGQVLTLASGVPTWSTLSAVTTLGTFTTTSYAAGGTISGTTLTLSAADGTNPGLVSTAAQTFAGAKTFTSVLTVNPTASSTLDGAQMSIAGQNTTGSSKIGGAISFSAGSGGMYGAGGAINLTGGAGGTSANGGDINISGGTAGAAGSTGGNIKLTPGGYSTTTSGTVSVVGSDLFVNNWNFRVGMGKNYITSNTAVGIGTLQAASLSGGSNSAFGMSALSANTTGSANTALGTSSLFTNVDGVNNTAVGNNSLNANSSGGNNVALGYKALQANSTGSYNVAVGANAIYENAAGNNNVGVGYFAMRYNNASNNVALGYYAGGGLGFNNSIAGDKNVFLGNYAGYAAGPITGSNINTTGSNSVMIGYDVRPAATGETNEIVISGYNGTAGTVGQGSNTTSIGNANTTKSVIYGSILSNLPAVSTTGSGGDFTIEAQDAIATGNTNGGNINLTPGNSNGTGTPGKVNVNSVINVAAGTATASVNGLSSAITAQNGGTGNTNGGNISLTAGTPSGTGAGGNITLTPGAFSGTASSTSGYVNIPMGTTSANWGVNVSGSVDDFLEYNIKNNSTGTKAQSGFNAIANNGTETSNFVWMGINNQNFNNPQTYNVGSANDVTFMGAGNDLHVANANNSKSIIFSTGISTTPYFSERMRITSTGNVGIGTNSPTATLEVAGQVKITGGTPGVGKVLTSDANGLATWKSGVSAVTRATLSSAGTTNLTTDQNYFIVLSTSVTGQVINLPDATANAGKEYTIKNLSAFSLSITATAGKLVQDNSTTSSTSASVGIEPSNNWIKVISDGTDWIVFRALF